MSMKSEQASDVGGILPSRTFTSYVRSFPESCGFLSVTTALLTSLPCNMERVAFGGSFKKLFCPSLHIGTKSLVGICPARRSGRSEKQIVNGSIFRRVSFPSAKASPSAFWTKSTWTVFIGFVGLISADEAISLIARPIIKTPMHPVEAHQALAALHPVGRMGDVSDIVDAVLYLDGAGFVTGEILHVDGGQAAGHHVL